MSASGDEHVGERVAYLLRLQALARLAEAFGAAGLEGLLVKGAALALTVYQPRPWERPMQDIDVLVSAASFDRALAAVAKHGFEVARVPADRRWSHALLGERAARLRIGAAEVLIELHPGLDKVVARPIPYQDIMERSEPAPELDPLRVPDPLDHLLLVVLHLAISDFSHDLAYGDLERLLALPLDADELVARARAWRLCSALHCALLLLQARGFEHADLLRRTKLPSWRQRMLRAHLDRMARGGRRELGLAWIARQTVLRDDPLRWAAGLVRYATYRAVDRLTSFRRRAP